MVTSKQATVTERRAILTDREREIITGDADVEKSYRYQTISRVRARFDRLDADLRALEEHGELAREFREIVCGEETPSQERRERREELAESDERGDTAESADAREPSYGVGEQADSPDGVLDDILEGWRPGQSHDRREQRRAAGRAALEYLRDRGAATAAEFRADVEPDHPVDGQSPETWWKKTARPALKQGQEAGLVTYKDGVKEWRWQGNP